jgi:hypothetical protein
LRMSNDQGFFFNPYVSRSEQFYLNPCISSGDRPSSTARQSLSAVDMLRLKPAIFRYPGTVEWENFLSTVPRHKCHFMRVGPVGGGANSRKINRPNRLQPLEVVSLVKGMSLT